MINKHIIIRNTSLIFIQILVFFNGVIAQCPSAVTLYDKVLAIEDYVNGSDHNINLLEAQLVKLNDIKKQHEACRLTQDSVYARILHRIGDYEYQINNHTATVNSIDYTLKALSINTSSSKGACKKFAVKSYLNLGIYFKSIGLYSRSINYFDSVILLNKVYEDQAVFTSRAIMNKIGDYFNSGDYQKDAEECSFYINIAKASDDSIYLPYYFNQRAQAFIFQDKGLQALTDIDSAMHYAFLYKDGFELATALKSKAMLVAKNHDYVTADSLYTIAIKKRIETEEFDQIGKDYLDYGNFFLNDLANSIKAKDNYLKAIQYALKVNNDIVAAQAYGNIAQVEFRLQHFQLAEFYYTKAFSSLNVSAPDDFLRNASSTQLSLVYYKDLLIVLLNNKTELLLHQYKATNEKRYLQATLQTALLTDSVITQLRHEQIGEQSKLYWRNKTREFFTNALEACYLAYDTCKAFFFMEKSRAVLLSDKLNELGALAYIPDELAAQEEDLQMRIVEGQQKLSTLSPVTKEYRAMQIRLYDLKDSLEKFIQTLEQNYTTYYQYKYADRVPTLALLKRDYLAPNHQSFVHYFMNDTVMYILGITPDHTTFKKLTKTDFNSRQLTDFLNLCSDIQKLNDSRNVFVQLSQSIYRHLFEPLHLQDSNIAICTDNFIIPFEALCKDNSGNDFLLYHYNFSYVHSARALMKNLPNGITASGNFIGFAPVSFKPYLQLVPLKHAEDSLDKSAEFYSKHALYTESDATRSSFFRNAARYAIITIFSHARADTSDREPMLYMQDSAIYLSELQLLTRPLATQFVLLSACQTNIGKNAAGEGIYSLARGFAAVGIPAVAGTMWKADDHATYTISANFNKYLALGWNKSAALRQAKIDYIKNTRDKDHQLPYYWANMVLIGNTQPIDLIRENNSWLWIMLITIITSDMLINIVVLLKRTRYFKKKSTGIFQNEQFNLN